MRYQQWHPIRKTSFLTLPFEYELYFIQIETLNLSNGRRSPIGLSLPFVTQTQLAKSLVVSKSSKQCR